MAISYDFQIGKADTLLSEGLKDLDSKEFLKKMWQRDGTVWTADPRHHVIAAHRLGWLDLPGKMRQQAESLEQFARDRVFRKASHIVHLGMGGSSLAPEVFFKTFGNAADYPELIVLDSTDPDHIQHVISKVEIESTLFIVASKSGGTIETASLAKLFYDRLTAAGIESVAEHFVAITDAGTALAKEGKEKYDKVFINPSDIGGRYSALSYFGLVPFALLGRDLMRLLRTAVAEEDACGIGVRASTSNAVRLGSLLGKLAATGINKLTIETSSSLSTVGWWIEQLVAESTGKAGKGILPVTGEEVTAAPFYSKDRVFVYIRLKGDVDLYTEEKIGVLRKNGFPVITIELDDPYDIGGLFYHWEIATAAAASILSIDPFDEPNVQESKDNTRHVLQEYESTGTMDFGTSSLLESPMRVYGNAQPANSVQDILNNLFSGRKSGDYLAMLAYLPRTVETGEMLFKMQSLLRNRLRVPVTVGYGPRYLHSTGQFHKGGTPNGLFLQLVHDPVNDYAVPGEKYSFSALFRAQAIGDYISLKSKSKPIVSLMLGKDFMSGLKELFAGLD